MQMDEPHSHDERQRLKEKFCDAVRVFCQSSVRYSVQLSVEALIGITVDGGKDSLIFSLNEVVDKCIADDEGDYYDVADDPNQFTGDEYADYVEEENTDCVDYEDGEVEHSSGAELYTPYGTVIKEELMSTISYNNVGQSHLQQATTALNTPHFKTEPYINDSEQYYGQPVNQQASGLPQRWPSATVASKSQTPGPGVQKRTVSANRASVGKGVRIGAKLSQSGGWQQKPAATGKVLSLNGEDAVAQITLYTCGTCGAQLSHHESFKRHKRSHLVQQSFGCEGCGKMIKRHDNLLTHQRRCQAYLSQFEQQ